MTQIKRSTTHAPVIQFIRPIRIRKVSKSSGTVTVYTLGTHGFTTGQLIDVEMDRQNTSIDTAGASITVTATDRFTYSLGSDSFSIVPYKGWATGFIDLTGSTVYYSLKTSEEQADNAAPVLESTTSHLSATEGLTSITVTAADMAIPVNDYFEAWKIIDSSGNISETDTEKVHVYQNLIEATS